MDIINRDLKDEPMSYKKKNKKKDIVRSPLEIQRDIDEAVIVRNKAIRNRDFLLQKMQQSRIAKFEEELSRSIALQHLHKIRSSHDKTLIAWQGKTLSLIINECDLAVKHQDMFFEQFLEDGFQPKESWLEVKENLEKALHDFRQYIIKMFSGENININYEDYDKLEQIVCKYMFTDREMIHYRKYEEKI